MAIPTSDDFKRIVAGPHVQKQKLKVQVDGIVVDELLPVSGTVSVDNAQAIRRTCSFKIIDAEGKYTPQGAADRFNPVAGTILLPESGVEIPRVEHVSVVVDTQEQWNGGTLTDILVNPSGSITIN